jgi:hypothetical protein
MESPKHLYGWFKAKGYENLTYRLADISQLPDKYIKVFDDLATRLNIGGAQDFPDLAPCKRLRTVCPMGFLLINVDTLFSQPWAEMALLKDLQEATICYREIRRNMGHPERIDKCKCGKSKRCRHCGGKGYTRTIVEMDDEETRLAHGD